MIKKRIKMTRVKAKRKTKKKIKIKMMKELILERTKKPVA